MEDPEQQDDDDEEEKIDDNDAGIPCISEANLELGEAVPNWQMISNQ